VDGASGEAVDGALGGEVDGPSGEAVDGALGGEVDMAFGGDVGWYSPQPVLKLKSQARSDCVQAVPGAQCISCGP